jgi:predicted amidohydrolase
MCAILKIALLQIDTPLADPLAALTRGEAACRAAAAAGADIALFPEMWNVGYWLPDASVPADVKRWRQMAITRQDTWFTHFQSLAVELSMAIAVTYLERGQRAPRNTLSLIDRHGQIKLTYAKVHTCDFDREALLEDGQEFSTCSLDTAAGEVRIGAMICMDREFPESARVLMLQGAEIVLVPNACELEANRLGQLKARAFENMVGIALANYPAPHENGHSVAYTPVAFDEHGQSQKTRLVECGLSEEIGMAEFDLSVLRRYREQEVWGNAYRKPGAYHRLVDENVSAPFIRKDARTRK